RVGPSGYAHREYAHGILWQRWKSRSAFAFAIIRTPWLGVEKRINAAKRSAVSTGQLSVLPHVHLRPIDLVVFQEPSLHKGAGDLVLQGVSRLDAFSVYPGRTWLPSAAASATTGTPEVRPSQSSRTREKAAQVSSAHNR